MATSARLREVPFASVREVEADGRDVAAEAAFRGDATARGEFSASGRALRPEAGVREEEACGVPRIDEFQCENAAPWRAAEDVAGRGAAVSRGGRAGVGVEEYVSGTTPCL